MTLQFERDSFGRLVCTVTIDGTDAVVTSAGAEAAAHDLLAALDDVTATGYGECLWPEVAGEYRWMLRQQGDALTVVALWSSGTGTGWQHVVHTQTTLDGFVRQLDPLRAMSPA